MAAPKATKSALKSMTNANNFENALKKTAFCVLFFQTDWHEPCQRQLTVVESLASDYKDIAFYNIDAEQLEELTDAFNVNAVPTLILLKDGKEWKRLEAQETPIVVDEINKFANHFKTAQSLKQQTQSTKSNKNNSNKNDDSKEKETAALNKRLAKLISAAPIMLFMKGTPENPKCKFSRQFIEILKQEKVGEFGYFDILSDQNVRSGLKLYSNWKTYPQFYVNNKLIGGLDIVKEMIDDDEFQEILPKKENKMDDLNEKLKNLVNLKKVMVFIKGSPSAPQCGFSAQIVQILKDEKVNDYGYFDILSDNAVRQGLKSYSNWPTYPQLYVNGKLIGGLDVVRDMIEDDEFQDAIDC